MIQPDLLRSCNWGGVGVKTPYRGSASLGVGVEIGVEITKQNTCHRSSQGLLLSDSFIKVPSSPIFRGSCFPFLLYLGLLVFFF